ncbi:hypothetical protein Poli38472_012438 [Pythium oligandrum]|uniref:Lipoxygenase domain-containing protein n=1 Tax=Pythium oligandrum TaxID=41045 RepID=A0A8K1FPW5_PYTOL|nr:hypothetical protein Poli38472_012438 [Pythium oligandrum]|eukprot:TMW67322.1 hypothetical protein Poli38472_012438 [Pythium oligandrum]
MPSIHRLVTLTVASLAAVQAATTPLSIPSTSDVSGPRAAAIASHASEIANAKRTITIAGGVYPFYDGPVAANNSLTAQIQDTEVAKLATFTTTQPQQLVNLATSLASTLTSMEAIANIFTLADPFISKPMAMDNSDETFGHQRLTIKSFTLRLATNADVTDKPLSLSSAQLGDKCGNKSDEKTLLANNQLFVENFSNISLWNDPVHPEKYAPNVVGFFCFNKESQKLLPIEIRFPDTKLAYTSYDTADEWTLAKMGLEAASVLYHQMSHMAETHSVTIPIRVELFRNMAEQHPVRALLVNHIYSDFALEKLAGIRLLNESTALDQTFGWGATGSNRFLYYQTNNYVSFKRNFFADINKRGLYHIPNHKYAHYGSLYFVAIRQFVEQYVNTYYASDAALTADFELQNWAKACPQVSQLHDFPSKIETKTQLRDLLTHLIFLSTIHHHAMNSMAMWHGMAVPYSPAALWKPLPTAKLQKGEKLNLLEYTVPVKVIPVSLGLGSMFYREVPESESLVGVYKTAPFNNEPLLKSAIDEFHANMVAIDAIVVNGEKNEKWPFDLMRPQNMSYYTWV